MQILASVIISALMVLGSLAWTNEHKPESLGANTLISALSTGTSLDDADHLIYNDNSGTPTTKKITWANATSSLQTFYNGVYQTLLVNSAGLRGALSDETGSGGAAVFATGPTISGAQLTSTPTLTDPVLNGTITGTGVLGIAQGGTGSTTKSSALNALLPTQTGNSGKFGQTDGTNFQWASFAFPTGNPTASSSVFISDTSGNIIWDRPVYALASSSDVFASTTVDSSVNEAAGTVKIKEVTLNIGGCGIVNYYAIGLNNTNGSARLYINGSGYGTNHTSIATGSYTEFTDPFCADAGDEVQLYVTAGAGNNIGYKLVKYKGTVVATTTTRGINLDI